MIPPKISMQVFIIIIAIFFIQVNNFAEIGAKFQNTIDKPTKILYNNLVFYFAMLKVSQIHSCELTRKCGTAKKGWYYSWILLSSF